MVVLPKTVYDLVLGAHSSSASTLMTETVCSSEIRPRNTIIQISMSVKTSNATTANVAIMTFDFVDLHQQKCNKHKK